MIDSKDDKPLQQDHMDVKRNQYYPLLPQLWVFLAQLGFFLGIDWLDVKHDYTLPFDDQALLIIILLTTLLIYFAIFYRYFN